MKGDVLFSRVYHKHGSLEGSGGVHYALQDDGFKLIRVHLVGFQRDSIKESQR